MTEKRFTDDGFEAIEEQSFTDNHTGKTYYVDYFDDIIELCNSLAKENEGLKKEIENNSALFKEVNRKRLQLEEENDELKSENKELIELIRHCYENWSEEKKKMVGEISNGLLGDVE